MRKRKLSPRLLSLLLSLAMLFSLAPMQPLAADESEPDTSDLRNFLTGFTVNGVEHLGTVIVGESYAFSFTFAERGALQFVYNTNGVLEFPLPANILIPGDLVDKDWPISGTGEDSIGIYRLENGLVKVKFSECNADGTPTPGTNFIDNYTVATFTLNFEAEFKIVEVEEDGSSRIAFADGHTITVYIQNPPEKDPIVKVKKDGDNALRDGKHFVDYKITITAENGPINNISLEDSLIWLDSDGNEVRPIEGPGIVKAMSYSLNGAAATNVNPIPPPSKSPLLYTLNFPGITLLHGESIVVNYTICVDDIIAKYPDLGTPDYYYSRLSNKAAVYGKDSVSA